MRIKLLLIRLGALLALAATPALRADVLEMQNGDRYSGQILSMSADTVVLKSEILGKINVPRSKVASLTLGASSKIAPASNRAPISISTNMSSVASATALTGTNANISAAFQQLGPNTNFVGQVRQQLLTGNPEAAAKYDEMVSGLLTGQLRLSDVRREAQNSAAQLRALKQELGPEADDALDGYLQILDSFLKETTNEPGR